MISTEKGDAASLRLLKEAALPTNYRFAGNRARYPLVIRNFADSKSFPFFFFLTMESILNQLVRQETWEAFLAYRLMKGRFNWHEFKDADSYVEREAYLPLAQQIVQGAGLGIPRKKIVNKMGTGKKRVVYGFAPDMWAYKLDIHDYFNSISIDILLPMLAEMMACDQPLYRFFEKMLTDNRVEYNGETILESHGVMAGVPTAPFLADVYLKEVDQYFHDAQVVYARYSDDIILFAPDRETLMAYKSLMAEFLRKYRLEVNPDKEHIYSPDEPFEFLGFKCHAHDIDISEATKKKMKGKIRRATRSLMRWKVRNHMEPEKAMKGLIHHFNRVFFENDDTQTLTWSRWFFPVINKADGLREIDHYLQQNIRYLSTGKHNKTNYKTDYAQLKQLGYRSLVNEYYSYLSNK